MYDRLKIGILDVKGKCLFRYQIYFNLLKFK